MDVANGQADDERSTPNTHAANSYLDSRQGPPINEVGGFFRVEHRVDGEVRVLGSARGVFRHFTALDPYIAKLGEGTDGEVVLIDLATETVVARRKLDRRFHLRRRRNGCQEPPVRAVRSRRISRPW